MVIIPAFGNFLFIYYFLLNIYSGGVSAGNSILALAVVVSVVSFIVNINYFLSSISCKILLGIFAFRAYVFYLSIFTVPDMFYSIKLLFDSNLGALYVVCVGFFVSSNLAIILLSIRRKLIYYFNVIIFLFSTIFILFVIDKQLSFGFTQHGVLSFDVNREGYQRLGNLSILINIIFGVTLVQVKITSQKIILSLIYIFYSISVSMLCILSLSNTGFVTNIVFMFCTISIMFYKQNKREDKLIIRKFIINYGLISIFVLIISFITLLINGLDVDKLRIFDTSQNSSFYTRWIIFKTQFFEQLSINPIFGNMNSHYYTSGEVGGYVHSLLSVFTHSGILAGTGFVVLLAICLTSYNRNKTAINFYLCLSLILLVLFSLISTFFKWLPLWFLLCLFINLSTVRDLNKYAMDVK